MLTERGETVLVGTGRNLVDVVNKVTTLAGAGTFQEHPVEAGEVEEVGDDPTYAGNIKVEERQAKTVF